MRYSVNVKTAPLAEPITRSEAKLHLRVDGTDDDSLIDSQIIGGREWTENYCRRSWVQRTLELRLDCFPAEIRLPRGPVSSVSSVSYLAQDGSLTVLAASAYQVDLYGTPPRILPSFGSVWPVPKFGTLNAVVVEYVAGYAPLDTSPTDYAGTVPAAVKAAMKLIIGHLHRNRELATEAVLTEVPFAVKALLAMYEIRDFTLE